MSDVTILLAPSKTMDYTSPLPFVVRPDQPAFEREAGLLAARLAKLSQTKLAKLMSISPELAASVHEYYQAWDVVAVGRPALWTYVGDVYKGVKADQLSQSEADWAQTHLLISSGLYGLVRPYDGIQAYRLEMKTMLKAGRANNLNEFWGKRLSAFLDHQGSDWLCNLCSDEYSKIVTKYTKLPIITPVFIDTKPNGAIGPVPIYSKMMRGVMARWMIDRRVSDPAELAEFTAHGYIYDEAQSKPDTPVYRRLKMTPLRFD